MAIQYSRRVVGLPEPTEIQMQTIVEMERSSEGNLVFRNNELQGLFPVHVQTDPTSNERDLHRIDFIAVHGLGGDVYRTWQHDSGFNWLQNIHEVLPGIRTYSYGFDSVAAFATGVVGLSDFARHLLALIKSTRVGESVSSNRF